MRVFSHPQAQAVPKRGGRGDSELLSIRQRGSHKLLAWTEWRDYEFGFPIRPTWGEAFWFCSEPG